MDVEKKNNEHETFITRFHNLEGALLKEKKKSFFLLLNEYETLKEKENILQKIIENLKPRTYLEEIYKFEILLHFKRAAELLVILKNGNDFYARKIIHQSWFIQASFQNMNPEEFVQNIFPSFSLVVRTKILKKILKFIKNEDFINCLFDELMKTYGFKPAFVILPGCSVDKIKEILKNLKLRLSGAQMKLLYEKDPSLIGFYYEQCQKRGGSVDHIEDFAKYLSKKDPDLYISLNLNSKHHYHRLGYRTTRKYVSENKQAIIEEPQKYLEFLEPNALVKELGKDFPKFLQGIFPKRIDFSRSDVQSLLKSYPKKKRYEVYSKCFSEAYKKDLFNNKEYMSHDLLKYIPDYETREKWVEVFENNIEYIKYKRSSLAIPELKDQLFKCDNIKLRGQLFQHIIANCGINNDYDSLLDILKLFCKRYRNTDVNISQIFLGSIKNKMNLEKLNEKHWECIHEIILLQKLKNASIDGSIIFEYCRFLFKIGKSFDEMIPLYFKASNFLFDEFKTEEFKDDNFEKIFLTYLLKHPSNDKEAASYILLAVRKWNKSHPNDKFPFSELSIVLSSVKKDMDSTHASYNSGDCMKYLLCEENKLEIIEDIYFKYSYYYEDLTFTKWFLKYKPSAFKDHIDLVLQSMNPHNSILVKKFLKKYEHLGLVELVIKYYLGKFKEFEEVLSRTEISSLLASIMTKEDYLKLLEENVPSIDKLVLQKATEEEKNLYEIQLALVKTVGFTNFQQDALPVILKYCRGDFFQSALCSLYSCFVKTPEKSLRLLSDTFLEKPVSVRKHLIFLSAMAFPISMNRDLGKKIMKTEENESVKKHLLTSFYKYFLKNPLDEFWYILYECMGNITFSEKESLTRCTKIHDIPEKYQDIFAKRAWEIFENIKLKENTNMNEYFDMLLENIEDNDIDHLSTDFCKRAIESRFFNDEIRINVFCKKFAIDFMMYGKDMKENIEYVLAILQKYKNLYWNIEKSKTFRSCVYSFFKSIYNTTMKDKAKLPKEFSQIFTEEWRKIFTPEETFEENFMLELMILKYEESNELTFYAKKICEIFDTIINLYGVLAISLLKDVLSSSISDLLESNYDLKLIKLLFFILQENQSLPICTLVIELLPSTQTEGEFQVYYTKVMEILHEKGDLVQIYLNTHYKEMY